VATALIPGAQKDAYNQDANVAGWADAWGGMITDSLVAVDALGGGDPLLPPAAVGPVLAADYLLVDASKPYEANGYLHVELGLVGVLTPEMTTSGGRSLTQNVLDLTLAALVGTPLDSNWDCVVGNDKEFPAGFPYLADPH